MINLNKNSNIVVNSDINYILNSLSNDLKKLSGKKILITGGAGFLGYYLIQSLVCWNKSFENLKPIQILVYDNFIRGMPNWLKLLRKNPNIMIKKYDIILCISSMKSFVAFGPISL